MVEESVAQYINRIMLQAFEHEVYMYQRMVLHEFLYGVPTGPALCMLEVV